MKKKKCRENSKKISIEIPGGISRIPGSISSEFFEEISNEISRQISGKILGGSSTVFLKKKPLEDFRRI